jgi:hypothetical protein
MSAWRVTAWWSYWPLWLRRLGFGPCPHGWRPALTSKGPARACSLCETVEQLEDWEFYAQFGRPSLLRPTTTP